jgi:hypothetical protein
MSAPLDLGKVIAGAFVVPWWHRKAFARALAIPVALFMAFSLLWYYYGVTQLPWFAALIVNAVYGIVFTLFAVTCHRLVLLDPESVARAWRPRWTLRETRFILWLAGLWLVGVAASMALLAVFGTVWINVAGDSGITLEWVKFAVQLALLYPLARVCVLFPATAVERDPLPNLGWAWDLTRDNGWRLVVVVGFLPWLFAQLADLAYRSNATRLELLLLSLLAIAFFAVEIAAVSISYRELTKKA